jgi:hypothetical protein
MKPAPNRMVCLQENNLFQSKENLREFALLDGGIWR